MKARSLLVIGASLVVVACAKDADKAGDDTGASVPDMGSEDADLDGLSADFEALVGTSDDEPDTDGDGCGDAVEVLTHFSPTDPDDRPYTGAYPRGLRPSEAYFDSVAAELGEGWTVGELNPNWSLPDQHGEAIELRDFYGQVVLIDISSEWCGPCQEAAPVLEEMYQEWRDQGFVAIQILVEGVVNDAEPAGQRWAEAFDLTYPVVEDYSPGDRYVTEVAQYYIDTPSTSYYIPNFSVIGRDGTIQVLYYYEDDTFYIEQLEEVIREIFEPLLAEAVPEVDEPMPDNADALRAELGLTEGAWVVDLGVCG